MENYISDLDTKRFGFKVAKIDSKHESIAEVIQELRKIDVKLILTRVKSWEIEKLNQLEDLGFRVKDTQVTYSYNLEKFNIENYNKSKKIILREFILSDTEEIVKIAKNSFNNYGHYAADSRLDKNTCRAIYEDWALRSCIDKQISDKIFVAEFSNEIVGFLSFKLGHKNDKPFAAGVMGAVNSNFQNLGIFSSLVIEGLLWGKSIGVNWVEHNAITANYSVNHSFTNCGFGITDSFITLHCWLD
jgi:hypothetical protein